MSEEGCEGMEDCGNRKDWGRWEASWAMRCRGGRCRCISGEGAVIMLFTSVKGQCGGDAVCACLSGPQSDSYRGHSQWREKDASAVSSLAKILDIGSEFRSWFHPSLLFGIC